MPNPDDFQMALPQGYALRHLAEVDSTNSEAQRWLESGQAPQALFIGDIQTAGRGRRGREWQSPGGNLFASLLIPAPETHQLAGRYGFVISLAIRKAIGRLLPRDKVATLKWPNDVLIDGAKVSGVLLELAEGPAGSGLIIGFGVNITAAPEGTPYQATCLADAGIVISTVALASSIVSAFWHYEAMPLPELLAAWREKAQGIGAPITVNLPHESIAGVFLGLAADGALQLQLPDGSQKLIHNGDVFFPQAT